MKIIYIADSIIPSQTANSVHVMKMCQALSSGGTNDLSLILPNKIDKNIKTDDIYDFYGSKECFRIVKLYRPKIRGGFLIFSFLSIMEAIKNKPNLIYTRFLYSCFFASLFKLPTIFEIHAPFTTKMDIFFFKMINKNKLKKIVVISKALKSYFIEKYNISSEKIMVAPDGADSIPEDLKPIKIKKNKNFLIGYIGHLYKGRGIDIIAEVAKRCDWAEFHVIGGLPEDVNYWKKELSNFKNIIIHGSVPPKEVYGYMLNFDILLAPYQEKVCVYGGRGNTAQWMSPLKIFEYMAAGKAILASDMPALREILVHEKNSLLASPRNIDKWVENLERIKKDFSLRKKIGAKAKSEFEERYTWRSRADFVLNGIRKR